MLHVVDTRIAFICVLPILLLCRNSVEFPRFVSDAEHHLVFSTAASPRGKEKV